MFNSIPCVTFDLPGEKEKIYVNPIMVTAVHKGDRANKVDLYFGNQLVRIVATSVDDVLSKLGWEVEGVQKAPAATPHEPNQL